MSRARWFSAVAGLQALLLLAWAGYHEWNRATAETILLETAPVDPRDLLRGDYMILNYKISRVPRPADMAQSDSRPRRPIWVSLRRNGRFHEVVGTSATPPVAATPGVVVVVGRMAQDESGANVRVEYDIEKYFVPEGRGQPQFSEMVVEATVSKAHRLGIKRLLIDGQPYP
jgi:uncharacterized membrane-anchored protein